ncbi:MAG: hypothetical protein HUK14_08300 [Muribaculaceae bacterium]|nr:hypothetical protein [Muribaculaceae bacterium]
MKRLLIFLSVALALTTISCNRLTKEARAMTGNYYIPELSEDVAIMELNDNGKCVMRAVNPGVLTFSVEGRWNVKKDSLIMDLKPETLTYEGDSTLIGEIPAHSSRYIADFNGINLTLQHPDGLNQIFHRRPK